MKDLVKQKGNNDKIRKGILNYMFQDAEGVYRNSSYLACFIRCIYLLPFRITVKYRFIQYLEQRKHFGLLTKWFKYRYNIRTAKLGCYLEPETKIGKGVRFPHAFPLVIHSHAVLGENCIIHPNVQIGTTRTKQGAPVIGSNVFFGNGCHIIGNCKIGNWVFVSPGAFVCKDIPEGSVVGFGLNNIISNKGKETVQKFLKS